MKVGHVDGKGSIYDEAGNLIVATDETLLCRTAGDNLSVSEGSRILNMKILFQYTAEKGETFITDRRLVFLRKPDPFHAAKYDAYPLGMADAIANAIRARDLKKVRALEFCEIDLSEVQGFWVKGRDYGVLFLKSDPSVTRKAIMYRRGSGDRKFEILRDLLSKRLPPTEPEDRRGNFLLGNRYPFRGRRRR